MMMEHVSPNTVGRIPRDDVMHRDQLTKAVAELHTVLVKV
jgi:hypothetical protein